MSAFEFWKDGVTISQRDGSTNHLNSILICDIGFEIMKTVDWTKPICTEGIDKIPARFIGFRSNGQAVVEWAGKVYAEVDPKTGRIGFLKFINESEYKYVPFDRYEDAIPLIGKRICAGNSIYKILGIHIYENEFKFYITNLQNQYNYIQNIEDMLSLYTFEDTKEPVGKKVEV